LVRRRNHAVDHAGHLGAQRPKLRGVAAGTVGHVDASHVSYRTPSPTIGRFPTLGVEFRLWSRPVDGISFAQAVLDFAPPGARLIFSSGWHISLDGQDVYPRMLRFKVVVLGGIAKLFRAVDMDDQVEACRRVFASDTRWTVVRGSELEEGESEGLPVWSRHVGDPILKST
jgi:hypothetical protein